MYNKSSVEFSLDDVQHLPSGELERYIQTNFGMGEENQQMSQETVMTNGTAQLTEPTAASPMFSSAALAQQQQQRVTQTAAQQLKQNTQPYVEITEQPQSRGLRFRYECEGRSAGSIPGERSTVEKKTYPTIKIRNYKGPAIVVVSCVTKEAAPNCKPHPHALVGTNCKKGVCTVKVRDTDTITFPHLGIQCAKKKEVENSLKQRKEINVDPFQSGFQHSSGQVDLNVVRLCFQVFLPDANGKITRVVPPVVSVVIHDKKSVNELTICRVDRSSGKAKGGDEIFLLCEKVNKDDIQVRFYQESPVNNLVWEEFGDFGQGDVHRQYAIVFKTPPYAETLIQQPVEVMLQLKRPSDNEVSEPIPFTYMPEDPDPDRIEEKRKRKAANFIQSWTSSAGMSGGQNANVKEGLRTKLKANRRIKQEGEPMEKDELPRYSFTNTGASVAASQMVGVPTSMNFRTSDNTAMGSMTVSNQTTIASSQIQGIHIDHTGNIGNIDNAMAQPQVLQQLDPGTIDMDLLQAYIADTVVQGEAGDLSANLLETAYDPNIAAMESVSCNQPVQQQPGTFAATQESLRGYSENS